MTQQLYIAGACIPVNNISFRRVGFGFEEETVTE